MNLAVNYSAPGLFCDAFLHSHYPHVGRGRREATHRCAGFMWDWAKGSAAEAMSVVGGANPGALKDSMQSLCYAHVKQQYLVGSVAIIGWLSWIVIEVIIGMMVKWFIEWLLFGGVARLRWFASQE